MNHARTIVATLGAVVVVATACLIDAEPSALAAQNNPPPGGAFGLSMISEASAECIACHKVENPALYEQWGASRHFRANIGCYECHAADPDDPDAYLHYDRTIAIIVSPRDCARCHAREVSEFSASHHSKGGRILGSLDNVLAEVVEGNKGMITPAFPHGVSAAAVNGCWQCHGSQVRVLEEGKLDPATWPNTGIGRINPDGSEGSCAACHSRHTFSAEQAVSGHLRQVPHGSRSPAEGDLRGVQARDRVLRQPEQDEPRLGEVGRQRGLLRGADCATCHMSATPNQPVTHDIGMRISWNNRPAVSIRPEVSDAKMGLPGANVNWQVRRNNMKDVCLNCHDNMWVDNFYIQYDALLELYNEKFAKPGLELYALAKPLMRPIAFGNKLDFVWFEIWHHEGRRARHGVSMMGPDYTHWHGTYEIAKHFYSDFIPDLEELAHKGIESGDSDKVAAGEALLAKLEEVLNHSDHKWYLGKMSPEEAAARKKAAEDFKKRYD